MVPGKIDRSGDFLGASPTYFFSEARRSIFMSRLRVWSRAGHFAWWRSVGTSHRRETHLTSLTA